MAETAIISSKGRSFWNAYSAIQADIQSESGYDFNRELLTYIQADDRYVSYVDEYLAVATNLTEPKETIRARAVAAHEESLRTLETSPGYSTDVQSLANDFYFSIERAYPNTPAVETSAQTPDPITARIDSAFAAATGATVAMPELEQYAARLRAQAEIATQPVVTAMGDLAMPSTPSVEETPVATDSTTTAAVTTNERMVFMPLLDTPIVTTPILPEVMPRQIVQEVTPVETPAAERTSRVPEAAVQTPAEAVPPEDTRTTTDHTVERGDSLWKIAREHYGLTKNADIQRAVDHIASINGLGEGTAANNIRIGQVLQIPNSPVAPEGTPRLDWEALDAETKARLRGQFSSAVNNEVRTDLPSQTAILEHRGPASMLG